MATLRRLFTCINPLDWLTKPNLIMCQIISLQSQASSPCLEHAICIICLLAALVSSKAHQTTPYLCYAMVMTLFISSFMLMTLCLRRPPPTYYNAILQVWAPSLRCQTKAHSILPRHKCRTRTISPSTKLCSKYTSSSQHDTLQAMCYTSWQETKTCSWWWSTCHWSQSLARSCRCPSILNVHSSRHFICRATYMFLYAWYLWSSF